MLDFYCLCGLIHKVRSSNGCDHLIYWVFHLNIHRAGQFKKIILRAGLGQGNVTIFSLSQAGLGLPTGLLRQLTGDFKIEQRGIRHELREKYQVQRWKNREKKGAVAAHCLSQVTSLSENQRNFNSKLKIKN